uniref:Uncharacterized protein n=1 Tax=Anguilla anguilla TaxID=7936 RepID=A0A0E9PN38_ANGAN
MCCILPCSCHKPITFLYSNDFIIYHCQYTVCHLLMTVI